MSAVKMVEQKNSFLGHTSKARLLSDMEIRARNPPPGLVPIASHALSSRQ